MGDNMVKGMMSMMMSMMMMLMVLAMLPSLMQVQQPGEVRILPGRIESAHFEFVE